MSTDVRMLPEAMEEVASAITQYRTIQTALGERFEQAFWRAVGQLAQNPMRFSIVATGVRRVRLRRFPWGIVYTLKPECVLIVAVMHLHRKPGYWRERMMRN